MPALKAIRGSVGLLALLAIAACLHMHAVDGAPTGAVLGIDLGSDNCVVAIARRKGVDIVTNEASARSTPTIVSVSNPCFPFMMDPRLALAYRPHQAVDTAPRAVGGWSPSCCTSIASPTSTHGLCTRLPPAPPVSPRLPGETYPPRSMGPQPQHLEKGDGRGVGRVCEVV